FNLHGARNRFQPFPTIGCSSDLSQLPATFKQSQAEHRLNLGADFRTLRTVRSDLKPNGTARQRPAAHCLNSLARLFLTEVGARRSGPEDRKQNSNANADKR